MRTRARTRARRGAQVDVNGDEKMEWSELTSYIVESHTGMGRALPTYTAVPPVPDQSRVGSQQAREAPPARRPAPNHQPAPLVRGV